MDSGINPLSVLVALVPSLRDYTLRRVRLDALDHLQVETAADVSFQFVDGARGRSRMDWLHEGAETRRIELRTRQHQYVIDLVQALLHEDGAPVLATDGSVREVVDQHTEYRGVYAGFVQHVVRRRSLVSTTELVFVSDCYAFAGQ